MSGSLQDESVVVVWTQDFLSSPYLNELKMRGHEALSWLQSAPQLQTNSQNVLAAPDDLPKTMPPALPPRPPVCLPRSHSPLIFTPLQYPT